MCDGTGILLTQLTARRSLTRKGEQKRSISGRLDEGDEGPREFRSSSNIGRSMTRLQVVSMPKRASRDDSKVCHRWRLLSIARLEVCMQVD